VDGRHLGGENEDYVCGITKFNNIASNTRKNTQNLAESRDNNNALKDYLGLLVP
jgi:hypothetical protein